MKVLLVEDNPADARLVIEAMKEVEDAGVEISHAKSLTEASEQLGQRKFDLVLLDLGLPESSGVETVDKLVSSQPKVPVVVLTGLHDETVGVEAIKRGAQDYLTKQHVFGNLLLRSMRYAIERKHLQSRMNHLNTVLRAIRNVNQLITQETDRDRLLSGVCGHLVEGRGYPYAWIVHLDRTGRTVTSANAGDIVDFDKIVDSFRNGSKLPCAQKALERPGIAVIENTSNCYEDCPLCGKFPGTGALARALTYAGQNYGILTASVPEAFVCDEEEASLFEEVAGDISFALHSLKLKEDKERTDKVLRHRERKYQLLVDSLAQGIWMIDENDTTTFVNPKMAAMLGYTVTEMNGRPLFDFMEGESIKEAQKLLKRRREGVKEQHEFEFQHKNGSKVYALLEAGPILGEKGEYRGAIAGVLDITERKLAEREIKQLHEYLQLQIDRMPIGLIVCDRDFRVTTWNPAAEAIFGFSPEQALGKRSYDLIVPEEIRPQVAAVMHRALKESTTTHSTNENITRDGRKIICQWSNTPLRKEDGTVEGVLSMVQDVTEIKKAEEAQREIEAKQLVIEELRNLDRLKDEFVSTVTHELRTPMTPLRSTVEMLLEGSLGEINPEQRRFIEMMGRNIQRLAQFTTEVLTLSRLESGRYKMHPKIQKLASVLHPSIELLENRARENNQTISLNVDEDLSACFDEDSLSQVVSNLVNNAIVHTSPETEILISGMKKEDRVEVCVSDNGEGIPEEFIENIFDRFTQSDRKKGPGYQGTGIGLAVCKALVEAMGGEISVESKVGEGTTFRFTLPVSPAPDGVVERD